MYVTQSKSACRLLKGQLRLFFCCASVCHCCFLPLMTLPITKRKASSSSSTCSWTNQLQQRKPCGRKTTSKYVHANAHSCICAVFSEERSLRITTTRRRYRHTFRNSAGKFGHKQKSRKQKHAFPLKTLYTQHTANICAQLLQLPNIQFILFFSLFPHILKLNNSDGWHNAVAGQSLCDGLPSVL